MVENKSKKIILIFSIFSIILSVLITKSYAKFYNEESNDWNVKITCDTKDLSFENTERIEFKVEENENVLKGKIAPGMKAVATMELDLTGNKYSVDFKMEADDEYLLMNNFDLKYYLDDEIYEIGSNKLIEADEAGIKVIKIELEWLNNGNYIPNLDKISLPINISVNQHI